MHFFNLPIISVYNYRNNIIATAGATQGLNLLSHLLFTSGDLVFVEDPTYFVAIKMLQQDAGFKCVPSKYVFLFLLDHAYIVATCIYVHFVHNFSNL